MSGVRDVGGVHRFDILETVVWEGRVGKVIGLTVEPSVTVEFSDGSRLTVGQSVLRYATPTEADVVEMGQTWRRNHDGELVIVLGTWMSKLRYPGQMVVQWRYRAAEQRSICRESYFRSRYTRVDPETLR